MPSNTHVSQYVFLERLGDPPVDLWLRVGPLGEEHLAAPVAGQDGAQGVKVAWNTTTTQVKSSQMCLSAPIWYKLASPASSASAHPVARPWFSSMAAVTDGSRKYHLRITFCEMGRRRRKKER